MKVDLIPYGLISSSLSILETFPWLFTLLRSAPCHNEDPTVPKGYLAPGR